MAHLHSLGFLHRDLKSANLFCKGTVDSGLTVKVGDLGLSHRLKQVGILVVSAFGNEPNHKVGLVWCGIAHMHQDSSAATCFARGLLAFLFRSKG
jgi:serine/threonine protein kinase